jgi:hypothetical protein
MAVLLFKNLLRISPLMIAGSNVIDLLGGSLINRRYRMFIYARKAEA